MPKRKWEAKTKAMIVLEGLKGKPVAEVCTEHRFEERLKLLCQPKLLIIDEIGYLPLDKRDATCLFQLVSRRYERGSIILTSNKSYSDWGPSSPAIT
jgi:DNA replication protein DnaC